MESIIIKSHPNVLTPDMKFFLCQHPSLRRWRCQKGTESRPCKGGMAGTLDELRDSCLGSGLRLAKTEVGTRSEVVTEVSVEVVEVDPAGEIGRHFFRMASAAAAAACAFFFSSSSSGLEGGVSCLARVDIVVKVSQGRWAKRAKMV